MNELAFFKFFLKRRVQIELEGDEKSVSVFNRRGKAENIGQTECPGREFCASAPHVSNND
jgi:hypothetical protein